MRARVMSPAALARLSGLAAATTYWAGCSTGESPANLQVERAWLAQSHEPASKPTPLSANPGFELASGVPPGAETGLIAYVDGQPIDRSRVVNLLLAGHGVGVLEQIVVLERARRMAADQGIEVTNVDLEVEYDRSLRSLLSPLKPADASLPIGREEAEGVLDAVLSSRNVSRAEYQDAMMRNAYLRAIVEANLRLTDEQIREEFERSFGPRVEIRHIQLANLAEAERIREMLDGGRDFESLAREYSANLKTAPGGGQLRPFTETDADVPDAIREAAFKMAVGAVSDPIRVDDWFHFIKIERRIPPESKRLEAVRPEVEARLRERLIDPAMQTLYRTLFQQADIYISDPVLAAEFERKHPARLRKEPAG